MIEEIYGPEVPADVMSYLREREPAATGVLAVVMRPGRHRGWKLWVVRGGGGDIVGVLMSVRYCFDRWTGVLLLDELDYAPEMAAALDRSNIWSLVGPADAIEAVIPLATRGRRSMRTWFHFMPYMPKAGSVAGNGAGALLNDSEVTVRPAVAADLPTLVAFYVSANRAVRPPWRRVRSAVRDALPYTLVAESSHRVVGAIMATPAEHYTVVNRAVVDPGLRGGKVAFLLVLHAALAAMADGRGFCGFRVEPRGLRAVERTMRSVHSESLAFGEATPWASAPLWPPRRFRGHTKLRLLVERVEDRVGKPNYIKAAS